MKVADVVFLNTEMPYGCDPSDIYPKGTKATIFNVLEYKGAIGGNMLYIEFETNKAKTWVHQQWFDEVVS